MKQKYSDIQISKIEYLAKYLASKDLDVKIMFSFSNRQIRRFKEDKIVDKSFLKKLSKCFKNVSYEQLTNDSVLVENLPTFEELQISQINLKIRTLDKYLKENKQIELYRAISVSQKEMQLILQGRKVSSRIIKKIASYFFIDQKLITDDSLSLPDTDKLVVDEALVSIQRDDYQNELNKNKSKHYISRSYRVLSHKERGKLIASSLLIIIPLLAYTGYCAYTCIYDRIDTIEEYKQDGLSEEQQKIKDSLDDNNYFCNVDVGSQLWSISNVDPSQGSYKVKMQLWFDFDQAAYHKMMYRKVYGNDIDTSNYTSEELNQDNITYHTSTGTFSFEADNVPDWIEVSKDSLHQTNKNNIEINPLYLEETSFYPGETSSNVYPDKETTFKIGNGDFDADTFSYEKYQAYTLTKTSTAENNDDGKPVGYKEFRVFQRMSFVATIKKAFDNPRYPLESIQFHIYVLPNSFSTEYLRYNPVDEINLRMNQVASTGYMCSVDEQINITGFSTYFKVGNGYQLINEESGLKNFVTRLCYSKESPTKELYSTEYEILVRANRSGMSTFLKAFINLFSVIIWICIAFYNQAYNNEDSIGMLGTGLFAAISSILVGLSMISDAGIFSIITMINIFTLAVILIMTYQSIASKRAKVNKDIVAIAYNGIKLRVLFIILTFCTLMMFIGLPLCSYIFGL